MTDIDLAAGQVMLRCPTCGTTEATDPAVLAGSPRIVCRNCGETWPAPPQRPTRLALEAPQAASARHDAFAEAARKPFAAYPHGLAQAWAAKIEADAIPSSRSFRAHYTAAALGAALFAAAFLSGRQVAVAALPDLAGLYAAIGLPVNVAGLAIEDVTAERLGGTSGAQLTIRGNLRNVGGSNRPVPPLMADIGATGGPAGVHGFDPPVASLAAGGTAPFVLRLDNAAPRARAVAVRFRRPGEAWPPAGNGASP